MRARLVRVGNSRGVRLSKPLLEQVGLEDEVELHAEPGLLTIRPAGKSRAGWAEAAQAAAVAADGELLDPLTSTVFDECDWIW